MNLKRLILLVLLCVLSGGAVLFGLAWWQDWARLGPLSGSGGLYWPTRQIIDGPLFFQFDPRWGDDPLASTEGTLAAEGCAVASAAMVLAGYGVDTDPGRLNAFLTQLEGGYTPQGWIYWEMATLVDPDKATDLLPHYEDLPSHQLIDLNLLRGNPVIARLRYPGGITHFVVITGKEGFDYLIRDPGREGQQGIYPLKNFGSPVEAIRFYTPPSSS